MYTGDHKLISSAFNQALAKLYAFSMMWTLNARRTLRAANGARTFWPDLPEVNVGSVKDPLLLELFLRRPVFIADK